MSDITITTSTVPDSGPVSSPSPTPSAPVSQPSDTGTGTPSSDSLSPDTTRPMSFAEALAKREAATGTATPTDPNAAAAMPGEAPIAPPDSPDESAVDAPPAPEQTGPIPFARHKAALENARLKTREEVVGQVQQQYGEHIRLGEAFRENPVKAAIQVLSELQENPAYAPQLASLAARMLANRRGQAAPAAAPDAAPAPDLTGVDGEGREVRFYSAEQQAKRDAWIANRLLTQMRQEMAPVIQEHKQTAAEREKAARDAQVMEAVSSQFNVWREQPGFTENIEAMRPVQAELVAQGMNPWTALGLAYAKVVLPKLQAKSTNQMVAAAARKAAGTTDNPSTVTPTPPTRARTFAEALERIAGQAG